MDYREILETVNNKVNKFELKKLTDLNTLSLELFYLKQPFVLAKEKSIEFYTYCAIQNICLCIDKCRDEYLEKNITLTEIEQEIKSSWNKDYNKF